MPATEPTTELEPQFSSGDATATPWSEARERLEQAELYWLSTVRPDGRPHVTPVVAIWLDRALYFCTGQEERKAKNLAHNAHCIVTTGRNTLTEDGLDLVVEGQAVHISDRATLQRIADAYEAKYGREWRFTVLGDTVQGEAGNISIVYELAPVTAFGFGKGATFSQTRWRF